MSRRLRIAEFSPLLQKIEDKLKGWAARTLSYAGRVVLIRSVIYGLLNFWMAAFILPKGCVKGIEVLCARFLWSGRLEPKYQAKIAWGEVCLPKDEGGIGLRKMGEWNTTLCLKLLWLLFEDSPSLWSKWHHHHSLNSKSIWELEIKPSNSWTWNKLLQLRPLAMRFVRGNLGNGNRLSFWFDNWSRFGPLISYVGFQGPSWVQIGKSVTVREAQDQGRSSRRLQRSHRVNIMLDFLDDLGHLPSGPRDEYCWRIKDKDFKKFPAGETWDEVRSKRAKPPWTPAVWFSGGIPRHSFIMWLACHNRLPTRSRLAVWDATIQMSCVICGQLEETRDHLFLSCKFAKDIWRVILHRLSPMHGFFNQWSELISWMCISSQTAPSRIRKMVGQAAVYAIWNQRNVQLHDGQARSASSLFQALDRVIRNALSARRQRPNWKDMMILWLR